MDTLENFNFLDDNFAIKFNPKYTEGEYLIIQTHPYSKYGCDAIYRTYNYSDAWDKCSLENMANDDSNFDIRIFHDGKLWNTGGFIGIRYNVSKEQLWKVHPDYRNANGEIEICKCSYLYFVGRDNILTCLQDDCGREITYCPNCNYTLVAEDDNYDDCDDEDFDDYSDIPSACVGCANYDGNFYGEHQLICAINPYGCGSDSCPDFTN
jgi:hypothetical protein